MPLMVSENGRQKRQVPGRAVGTYMARGWTVAGATAPEPPAQSDLKSDWVTFAKSQGYDEAEGLTKDELIERYG